MAPDPGISSANALADALVNELATAMGAVVGGTASVAPGTGTVDVPWAITIGVGEPTPATVTLALSKDDASRLTQMALGGDDVPGDAAVLDLLQELGGQAVGALREKPPGKGVLFCVETPSVLGELPAETPSVYAITLAPDFAPRLAVWTALTGTAAAVTAGKPVAAPGKRVKTTPAQTAADDVSTVVPANLDVILDIDLPLSVRFGETDLTLEVLTRLGPGSVIDLGRSPDDAVDVLVNGRLVARAEVVVVGGNYGVRIIEVVSAADRVRSFRT